MKAVKIKMKSSDSSNAVKALIISVLINILTCVVCLLFLCLVMTISGALFEGVLGYLTLIPLAVGGYLGGFCGGRINQSKGLIMGITSGSLVTLALIIVSFCIENSDITYMLILKALAVILFSTMGSVKGVNKKEKFRI